MLVIDEDSGGRAVAAQHLLQNALDERLGSGSHHFHIAVCHAPESGGVALDPLVSELLAETAPRPQKGHIPQPRDAESAGAWDLVLTSTREQKLSVSAEQPSAAPRTFTMREVTALLLSAPALSLPGFDLVGRAHALVELLQEQRSQGAVPADTHIDIVKPRPGSRTAVGHMVGQVRSVTDTLAFVLAPRTARGLQSPARLQAGTSEQLVPS